MSDAVHPSRVAGLDGDAVGARAEASRRRAGPALREPVRDQLARRSDPHVRRHARGRGTVPHGVSTSTAARSGTSATGSTPRVAGVRRRRLRGGDRQLPRIHRLRHRVPRGAHRQRLSARKPRTSSRASIALIADGIDRPRARLLERLVVGRVPRVLQRRCAPRSLARDLRRDPGRRLRRRTLGLGARAPGLGRRRLRRKPRRGARAVPRQRPDDLRRRGCARRCSSSPGEHDPRCPIEGVTPWVDAVRAQRRRGRGPPVSATGHHTNADEEQVRHMRMGSRLLREHAELRVRTGARA